MGSYVSFHSENHNFSDTTKLIREQGVTSKGIKIGNNVWVGAKVSFLDGSTVGNHCVVAAGAVVNGAFPDYSVIGGVPAKILKTIV
jgi:acetyltransferase-like isoleucine patch superfamily enzyme